MKLDRFEAFLYVLGAMILLRSLFADGQFDIPTWARLQVPLIFASVLWVAGFVVGRVVKE